MWLGETEGTWPRSGTRADDHSSRAAVSARGRTLEGGNIQVVGHPDKCDNSRAVVEGWRERMEKRGLSMVISGHSSPKPRGAVLSSGSNTHEPACCSNVLSFFLFLSIFLLLISLVGFAKNQAVCQSSGRYLCFQDADDVMMPQRVRLQYEIAVHNPTAIVGCQVRRVPEGSTERYTRWINSLSPEKLLTQGSGTLITLFTPCVSLNSFASGRGLEVYTSHGPTVVMPTWFCSRDWFHKVGPFDEGGKGVAEDLLLFYSSLRLGGGVVRVDERLLVYRYHKLAATHSVLEETIWNLRVDFLQERVLSQWDSFTIWNAGKQGRKFYRSLNPTNQKKVKAFCDVDENKIKKGFYTYEESKEQPKPKIPVLHFTDSSPPFIVCVKLVS
ncbi:hypothetical protein P4O66_021648, partial [Electrophorus voltai]